MKQRALQMITLLFISISLQAQEAWPDKSRVLPQELRKLPVALYIQHGPNPNYPEINTDPKFDEFKYVWKHETTVCSPSMDLRVLKAGSFIWYDESGWKENVQYSRNEFKKKFQCPKGELKKGACYTFLKNYRWGHDLYGGDALWYVIAEDKDGKRYKGVGLIETEVELLNQER